MRIIPIVTAVALAVSASTGLAAESQGMKGMQHMQGMQGMQAEQEPGQEAVSGKGIVTAVDAGAGTVTLAHEPIPALSWPSMTMTFDLQDRAMADQLDVNDEVTFEVLPTDNGYTITAIETQE